MTETHHNDKPDPESFYAYSEEDIARILSDAYVELRECMDEEDAAVAVDVAYLQLTDGFYGQDHPAIDE